MSLRRQRRKWHLLACALVVTLLVSLNLHWSIVTLQTQQPHEHYSDNKEDHPYFTQPVVKATTTITTTTAQDNYFCPATDGNDMNHLSPPPPPPLSSRTPTHHACDGYDGMLHIAMGDIGGAAGTVFFQFVVGQLLYAERYNLIPWIHFNNVSTIIYDDLIHGRGPGVTLHTTGGERRARDIVRPGGHFRDRIPGPPDIVAVEKETPRVRHFPGTGVWNDYFVPVSAFDPRDKSCQALPYVTLSLPQITPGIHGFAPWAPRCWRYHYLPDYVTQPHIPLHEWLAPHLQLGAAVVRRYFRFQPTLCAAAQRANPDCAWPHHPCLGLHIRHSDKSAGRRVIAVHEFLPYAAAFVHETAATHGSTIYVATDSALVLQEIQNTWPAAIRSKIRTMGDDIVRSSDTTAVFDMGISHDRTNREILVEIAALASCQYLVHGLSAVSDSVLWLQPALQTRSVNLELPQHMSAASFGTLIQMEQGNRNASHWPGPDGVPLVSRNRNWWTVREEEGDMKKKEHANGGQLSNQACEGYNGILHIQSVSPGAAMAGAFFTDVINQLLLAQKLNYLPWIHLGPQAERLYDASAHGTESTSYGLLVDSHRLSKDDIVQGVLSDASRDATTLQEVIGNGIWSSYFEPVSDFRFDDASCVGKPVASLNATEVARLGLLPTSVRAWQYDFISEWPAEGSSLSAMFSEMRRRGADIVKRLFRLAPHIVNRAREVNPTDDPTTVCLAVHVRHTGKSGKYRRTVTPEEYVEYMLEFLRAGGDYIYLGTDSRRFILHLNNTMPAEVTARIRTQGDGVVRMSKKWPPDMIDNHHRVNSEVLVDIEAMSKCQLMLHSYSTVPEAVIYLNPSLHNNSVNLEQTSRMSPASFGGIARKVVAGSGRKITSPNLPKEQPKNVKTESINNATILRLDTKRTCRSNAVVWLAQKTHSSYQRNSYGHLVRSIELLRKNYISIHNHSENLDIFIFHTSDFNVEDLREIESQFESSRPGILRIVDLAGSSYWRRPRNLEGENPEKWNAYPLFSEGYRRMIHFFAIDIWQFFWDYAQQTGCKYRYIMRLDEDSYIHSPIEYDIFDLMEKEQYVYGFRMCSYEMHIIRNIWQLFRRNNRVFTPQRDIDYSMCGFYNNFFVAKIEFFMSEGVQKFLRFVDRRGSIYRRRLGDLLIHSTAVFAFANQSSIHRFLDFTYEHGTINSTSQCLLWGGIQAGYNDPHGMETVGDYYERALLNPNCHANAQMIFEHDLSPTYQHGIRPSYRGELSLQTVTAGLVELPDKGVLSG